MNQTKVVDNAYQLYNAEKQRIYNSNLTWQQKEDAIRRLINRVEKNTIKSKK